MTLKIRKLYKKMQEQHKGFRVRLMLSLMLLSLGMLIYASIVSLRLAADKLSDVSLKLSESNTASAASAINANLQSVEEWSAHFLSVPEIVETALEEDPSFPLSAIITRDVMGIKANADSYGPRFEFVSVLLGNGYCYCSEQNVELPFDSYAQCMDYFAAENPSVKEEYTSPIWALCGIRKNEQNIRNMVYVRFVYHPITMQKLGVIVLGLQESWLGKTYNNYVSEAYVMSRSGILYSASGKEWLIGTPCDGVGQWEELLPRQKETMPSSTEYTNASGKKNIISFQQIGITPLYLVVPFSMRIGFKSRDNHVFFFSVLNMGIIGLVLIYIISSLISRGLSRSVFDLIYFTKKVEEGETALRFEPARNDEIAYLGMQINRMLDQLDLASRQREQDLHAQQELELQLNQMQINPHLLYNTLDTALWVLEQDKHEQGVALITAMSGFFKISLSTGKMRIPLSDELKLVEHYISIQHLAREKDIHVEYDIDPELYSHQIIKLTLQPLVENAVVHGFSGYREDGTILIRAKTVGEQIFIEVTDNGIGMLPEDVENLNIILKYPTLPEHYRHYGLFNISRRIQQAFGESYGLRIESEVGCGTTIHMSLPLR